MFKGCFVVILNLTELTIKISHHCPVASSPCHIVLSIGPLGALQLTSPTGRSLKHCEWVYNVETNQSDILPFGHILFIMSESCPTHCKENVGTHYKDR